MHKLSVVKLDEKFRFTLPKEVRRSFKVKKRQKLYIVTSDNELLIKLIPSDVAKGLEKIAGGFTFSSNTRRKAEEWLFKNEKKK